MKHILHIFALLFIISSCNTQSAAQEPLKRGKEITAKNAISPVELLKKVEKYGGADPVKIKAKIIDCCQKKGCWMNVDLENGEQMMVRFKDYGFFVPLDAAGKTVILQGKAYQDTMSVETLKHYAEDAGATQAEIDAITEPKAKLAFEAEGLLLFE